MCVVRTLVFYFLLLPSSSISPKCTMVSDASWLRGGGGMDGKYCARDVCRVWNSAAVRITCHACGDKDAVRRVLLFVTYLLQGTGYGYVIRIYIIL